MQFSITYLTEMFLPAPLFERLKPHAVRLDEILISKDNRHIAGRTALYTFSIRVLSAIIAYLSQILLARLMGSYDYGIYVLIWVWLIVLGTFSPLGLSTGVMRIIPELRNKRQFSLLRGLLSISRLFVLIISVCVAGAGLLFIQIFPDFIREDLRLPLTLAAFCLPMMALIEVQDSIARAYDWPDLAHLPPYIIRPLCIIAFFLIAIAVGYSTTSTTALYSTIGAVWFVAIGQFLIMRKRLKEVVPYAERHYDLVKWLKISLPMLLVEGFFLLTINTDIIIVGLLMEPEDVAVYYAAAKTIALIHFVYFAVRAGTAHKISHYHSIKDPIGLKKMVEDSVKWTFWPSLALSIFIALMSPFILSLFGEVFDAGVPLIFILLIGVLMRASIGPAEAILAMADAQTTSAKIYCFVFILNIVLNFTLIPFYGIMGAAIATSVSMSCEALLLMRAVKSKIGLNCFIARL